MPMQVPMLECSWMVLGFGSFPELAVALAHGSHLDIWECSYFQMHSYVGSPLYHIPPVCPSMRVLYSVDCLTVLRCAGHVHSSSSVPHTIAADLFGLVGFVPQYPAAFQLLFSLRLVPLALPVHAAVPCWGNSFDPMRP